MRFMVLVKASKDSEAGAMPSEQLLTDMGHFNDQLVKAGVMLAGEGLHPSSKGKRVLFSGSKRTVTDGPFAETKELVAGFWLWQCRSMEEAVEWVKRCPNPMQEDSEIEIRPVFEAADFGAEYTPELRAQEDRQRAEMERLQKAAQTGRTKSKNIFVNLPVKDLKRSVAFFTKVGYTFNAQFTDDHATCMIVGDNIFVMLLDEKRFQDFTPKKVADGKSSTEVLVALSAGSRDEVKRVVEAALAAGAKPNKDPMDHGFMYGWSYKDLDGHIWEYVWMDPAHIQ